MIASFPTTKSNFSRLSFASFWAFCSFLLERRRSWRWRWVTSTFSSSPREERTRMLLGMDEEGEDGGESRKSGNKERGTQLPSPLSSILDKNKVNGEWGCGGMAAAVQGSSGETARESCYGQGERRGGRECFSNRIVSKRKGERQKVRRSMLPATRNTMKTLLCASGFCLLHLWVSQGNAERDESLWFILIYALLRPVIFDRRIINMYIWRICKKNTRSKSE